MLVLSIFLCLIAYFLIKHYLTVKSYPKGPFSLPVIGNVVQLGYYTYITGSIKGVLEKFHEIYGSIFTLYMGPYPVILINDYDLAMEAMVRKGNAFVDRWEPPSHDVLRNGHGLITSNGEYWVEQRRFALHTLRNLGVSKNVMEGRILEECHWRFDNIKTGDVVSANQIFDLFTANIINRLLFSYRFDETNQDTFLELKRTMDYQMENISFLEACTPHYFLKFSYFKNRFDRMVKPFFDVKHFLKDQILERMEAVKKGDHELANEPTDFVDAFLVEMRKHEGETDTSFTLESLICGAFDLYFAGMETTSTTLAWGACYLLNHPQVTERVRDELRGVTGGSRDLSQSDKPNTPYFNATINEILRLSSIVTINLFRKAAEDVQIGDVTIRKGQAVTAMIARIMHDDRHFENPDEFNPDRYLTGDKLETRTIPFGIGKRSCLGESLARAELYLILGSLIQKYKFEAVGEIPSEKPCNPKSTMRRPEKFHIRLTEIE